MLVTQIHERVGADGVLKVEIPLGLTKANQVVTVMISDQPVPTMSPEEWADFIDRTAGSCAGLGLKRYPQGEYEQREELE